MTPPMTTPNGAPEPTTRSNGAPHGAADSPATGRVCVAYTFLRVRPTAFSLPTDTRRRLASDFEAALDAASEHLGVMRAYSVVGLRADADLLFWQAAEAPEQLQAFAAALRRTDLWAHLELSHSFLAMTRRSQYVEGHVHERQDGRRTRVQPANAPYLFVYPFVKTRAWYSLPFDERQRIMSEHIKVGHKYPRVKINTTYSFGLDDQEFVVAFEGDSPAEFLDLVMELRSSEASQYTLRDTPAFTTVAVTVAQALSLALGLET